MTLKEKFIEQSIDIRYQVLETEKFEKIADDYAIEFAEWRLTTFLKNADQYTMKELLEIFKKEKGL
jgi:hypothetical protein